MEYVAAGRRSGSTPPPHHHHHQLRMLGVAAADQSKRTMPAQQQQQRRLDLEQEVAELKKQLRNEQAVHDILERALHPNTTSRSVVRNIPAFIPPKAKELLAELVVVEEEIARLETQILTMKKKKKEEAADNVTTDDATSAIIIQQQPPSSADTVNNNNASNNGSAAAGGGGHANIKSMFFISQAINGDFPLLDPNHHQHLMSINNKPPSPKRSSHLDSTNNEKKKKMVQQQPNKLSERILKCLICIFIRLLRSSRVTDLQDSNNRSSSSMQARSGQLQPHQGGGSFRIDTGLMMNKQQQQQQQPECRSGQQDHYGIFAIQDSIVRDIGPYKNLVSFTSSAFDLRGFSTSPLLTKLRGMLEALQHVDLRFLTHHQKLAFWLNIYNTCIMHGILHNGLPSNSEKLLALKNKATLNVSGQKLNALVIENFILRQPSSVKEEFWKCEVDVEEQQVRGRYGLNSSEPNILFALCCGIRSSPAVSSPSINQLISQ
ncbi:hypothetical protein E2562_021673 [Oryza meyeriana var. granulata]|uniref:DUF547 domain-containing protein n=1 Tax=Oryza meyeriana var. granulata TaxID=110450 RepID=A0A6G1E0E7_9ORYZ|nr:hypothetical protein E2562_021673 [Oryza meyeriana var. granulata]KAF0917962.1 hypothetical protein E2562_021673 [Oryza meyeriana var. granulata]